MFELGDKLKLIEGAVPLNGIAPGLNVPLIVPLPVTAIESGAEDPTQIVCVPARLPVGRTFIDIVAPPVLSEAIEVQLASDNELTVYVVVVEGLTTTVIGLTLPLNATPFERVPLQGPVPVKATASVAEPPLQ